MKKLPFLGLFLFAGYMVFSQAVFIDAGIGVSETMIEDGYSGELLSFSNFTVEGNIELYLNGGIGFNYFKNFNQDFNYSLVSMCAFLPFFIESINSVFTIGLGFGIMLYNAREGVFTQDKKYDNDIDNNGIGMVMPINVTFRKLFPNNMYIFGRGNTHLQWPDFDHFGINLGLTVGAGIAFL